MAAAPAENLGVGIGSPAVHVPAAGSRTSTAPVAWYRPPLESSRPPIAYTRPRTATTLRYDRGVGNRSGAARGSAPTSIAMATSVRLMTRSLERASGPLFARQRMKVGYW